MSDSDPAQSAATSAKTTVPAPPPPPAEFDLLAFWIQYRKTIIRVFTVVLLGVAVWGGLEFYKRHQIVASQQALAVAGTDEELRSVVRNWPGLGAAGSASVKLAASLREQGKPDDAAQVLRDYIRDYPQHPLHAMAMTALGATLESAGKLDEALAAYQDVLAKHPEGPGAAYALISQARVKKAQNHTDDMRKIVTQFREKFPRPEGMMAFRDPSLSLLRQYHEDADRLLAALDFPKAMLTGGSPRPEPPKPEPPAPTPGAATPGAPNIPIPQANSSPPNPAAAPAAPVPPTGEPAKPADPASGATPPVAQEPPKPAEPAPEPAKPAQQ